MAKNREPVEVDFPSKMSKADNCICNACFTDDRVIKLMLPNTCFDRNGRKRTSYDEYWLCRDCRDKLVKALEWGTEDGK